MNVLEIIQRATNAIGITEPTVALASTSPNVVQLVELLNQEGRSLSSRYDWEALTFEQTITTVATESQGLLSALITNGHTYRSIINETIWNRTDMEPIYGPLSPSVWQSEKAFAVTGPYSQYRIRGGALLFSPAPDAGETCAFEFVSNSWVSNLAGTTYYRNVQADTDLVLLNDELMLAGLEWRWLKKKGLSYSQEFQDYERMVVDAMAKDGSKPRLSLENVPRETNVIPRLIGG